MRIVQKQSDRLKILLYNRSAALADKLNSALICSLFKFSELFGNMSTPFVNISLYLYYDYGKSSIREYVF